MFFGRVTLQVAHPGFVLAVSLSLELRMLETAEARSDRRMRRGGRLVAEEFGI